MPQHLRDIAVFAAGALERSLRDERPRYYHLGGRDFTWYLKYFGRTQPTEWQVRLPMRATDPHHQFRIDVLDTWNMTVTPVEGVFNMAQLDEYDAHDPLRPTVALPGKPYVAIRIVKV